MDEIIERIVRDNPTLDSAEAITVSVTREDRTKAHYYIFKKQEEDLKHLYVRIPIGILTRENGKGKHKHYIIVAVTQKGYEVYDLNKPRSMNIEGNTALIGDADVIGFNIPKDKINEPLPF